MRAATTSLVVLLTLLSSSAMAAELTRGPIEAVLSSSSNLEAEQSVKVFARTSNRVTELLVEEGDDVEKDQVLIRLLDDTQQTQFKCFAKRDFRHVDLTVVQQEDPQIVCALRQVE